MTETQENLPDNVLNITDKKLVKLVYILYLVGIVFGITSIIGLILAYMNKSNDENIINNHYTFQIRTFWIGTLFIFVGIITLFIFVGVLILIFALVWYIIRCIQGLKYIENGEPIPNPNSWMFESEIKDRVINNEEKIKNSFKKTFNVIFNVIFYFIVIISLIVIFSVAASTLWSSGA